MAKCLETTYWSIVRDATFLLVDAIGRLRDPNSGKLRAQKLHSLLLFSFSLPPGNSKGTWISPSLSLSQNMYIFLTPLEMETEDRDLASISLSLSVSLSFSLWPVNIHAFFSHLTSLIFMEH